jgi:2-phospho-L-lactate guanylyltransferase
VTTVVVPAKGFERAKTRLRPVLDDVARASLARSLFEHVLDVAAASVTVRRVVVVTDGDDVEAVTLARGFECLRDRGEPPLRLAVDLGLQCLDGHPADAAIVVMADLPWLCPADLDALAALVQRASVVVAPDSARYGTNALALARGVRLSTAFGRGDSFRAHLEKAEAEGLSVLVHETRGLGFDVDTPEDVRTMPSLSPSPVARSETVDRV